MNDNHSNHSNHDNRKNHTNHANQKNSRTAARTANAHFTLFLLLLRQSAWKVFEILVCLAGIQIGIFLLLAPESRVYSLAFTLKTVQSALLLPLVLAWILFWAVLLLSGRHGAYTLYRLTPSPRALLLWQGLCNTFLCLLFWAAETLVLVLLCQLYLAQGGYAGPQTLYLATWQNSLFHTLLPLDEPLRWLRNLCLCLGMGLTAACGSAQLRRGKKPLALPIQFCLATALIVQPTVSLASELLLLLVAALPPSFALMNLYCSREEDPHEASHDIPPEAPPTV